jgi:hypothetical protein
MKYVDGHPVMNPFVKFLRANRKGRRMIRGDDKKVEHDDDG